MQRKSLARSYSIVLWVIAVLFLSFLTVPHAEANLVTNGGFETGDFTGWTVTHASSGSLISFTLTPHSGTYAAGFAALSVLDDSISQTISTTPGDSYLFDFWVRNYESGSDHFQAFWDGTSVLDLLNSPDFLYTHYMFTEIATGASTNIQFSGYDAPAFYSLDDVSVTASSVPEPSTILLLGTGLAGVGLLRRRFKK